MSSDIHDNGREEQWRYEVRGSQLYDLTEGRTISLAEAGEILNAHQHLLITSGVWAAKAGLAESQLEAARAQAGLAQRYRDALEQIRDMPSPASDAANVALRMRAIAARALPTLTAGPTAEEKK